MRLTLKLKLAATFILLIAARRAPAWPWRSAILAAMNDAAGRMVDNSARGASPLSQELAAEQLRVQRNVREYLLSERRLRARSELRGRTGDSARKVHDALLAELSPSPPPRAQA